MPTCSIQNCMKPVVARSWCIAHYRKYQRHGDPLMHAALRDRCSIESCQRPARDQGYCIRHLHNYSRTGSAERVDLTFEERFWANVEPEGPLSPAAGSPCWLWCGGRNSNGYGTAQWTGSGRESPHGIAWALFFDMQKPRGLVFTHKCMNRICVRPDHLELHTKRYVTLCTNQARTKRGRKNKLLVTTSLT